MPKTNEVVKMNLTEVVAKFGPLTRLTNEGSWAAQAEGAGNRILTVYGIDVDWIDLPKADRPTKKELKDMGETTETYTGFLLTGAVGHSIVNVEERFLTAKPMPEGLEIEVDSLEDAGC